jgi:orotidine-5'-phosphate decarboxylase
MSPPQNVNERLIVALDLPSAEKALQLMMQLEELVSFYKVGLELYTVAGPEFASALVARGKKVFLDLKFLDIEDTVRRAARQAALLGASFLTVHECGNTVAAAVDGAAGSNLKVLAVTVLTSLNTEDIQGMGIPATAEELVLQRARKAMDAGAHGVIASGQEVAKIRAAVGGDPIVVTPGIRPQGADANDQKRVSTPTDSIAAGSDHLVVGRPIRDAEDPRASATEILREIQQASL